MHVSHHAPGLLEGQLLAWLQELVFVGGLAVVAGETQGVAEGLPRGLQVSQLIHYYFSFNYYNSQSFLS
jgi:hypothetical protein